MGVHVRTCRCTPPQTCVKLLSNGCLFTHKIWTRSAQPFARSGKRGVHVRTCRCTPPQTCAKLLSNRSLFTHKIWTQFAQPFARSGKRGVHVRTCRCTPPQTCVNPRPDGGGPFGPPWWFFVNNSNSVGNSALKFSVPLRASILRILWKNLTRGHPRSKVIEVKLRSCSAVFVKKSCFG